MVDWAPPEKDVTFHNPIARNGLIFVFLFAAIFFIMAFATGLTVYYIMFYMFMMVLVLFLIIIALYTRGRIASFSGFWEQSGPKDVFKTIVIGSAAGVLLIVVMGATFSLIPGVKGTVQNGLIDGLPITTFIFITAFAAPIIEEMARDVLTMSMYRWIPRIGIPAVTVLFSIVLVLVLWNSGIFYILLGASLGILGIVAYFTRIKSIVVKNSTLAIIIAGLFGAASFMAFHAATFAGQSDYSGILFLTLMFGITMFIINLFSKQTYTSILAHGIYNAGVLVISYGIDPVLMGGLITFQIFLLYMMFNPAGVLKGFGGRKERYRL